MVFFGPLPAQILKIIIVITHNERIPIKPVASFFKEILLHMPIPYFRFAKLTGNSKSKSPDFITVDKNTSPLLFSVVDHCQGYDEEHLKALLEILESQDPD